MFLSKESNREELTYLFSLIDSALMPILFFAQFQLIQELVFSNCIIIIELRMKGDVMLGNKIIYQKMHRKERIRHLTKLQQIKTRPPSFFSQSSHLQNFRQSIIPAQSEKNLQIERNNIALFNRIASILKQKPKLQFPKSRSFVKSLDRALFTQQKKQLQLKCKYQQYAKRISEQQPTIKNQIMFKDRLKHERYLKFIGKYPFNGHRRTQTQFQTNRQQYLDYQIFHQKSLDFDIKIHRDTQKNTYIFSILDLADMKEYKMEMDTEKFKACFQQCNLSYEALVGKLRMEKNGQMRYAFVETENSSPSTMK